MINRYVNVGFSGGEKKRMKFSAYNARSETFDTDETDSGLDADALRAVAEGVNKLKQMIMLS